MNAPDLLRQALDSLEECARLLGATQANKGFGCYTENDARFERLMHESIGKHRRCAIEAAQAQSAQEQDYDRELEQPRPNAVKTASEAESVWKYMQADAMLKARKP